MISQKLFLQWLRARVPPERWEQLWWSAPTLAMLLLPAGSVVLRLLGMLGWAGAPRATQGLIVLSVLGGFIVGSVILWSAQEAELIPPTLRRVQWLGRFAFAVPLLTLLILFGLARAR